MEVHYTLPIIFTKQLGYAESMEGKVKEGSILELPPDAVLVFLPENHENTTT